MKLVIIFGPHAVGKMTVGQQLSQLTGLKLFHNHMTIDTVSDLFENVPSERGRLINLFRKEIFEAFVKTAEKGLIFTYMWAMDDPHDWEYIQQLETLFLSHGAAVYYVELAADYDVRIQRNKTENRLLHKSTKRDLNRSETMFRTLEAKYRLNTRPGEFQKPRYLKIDNTLLDPLTVAQMIQSEFDL